VLDQLNGVGRGILIGFQTVRAVYLEPAKWTVEIDYVTPTFKLKWKKLAQTYRDPLEELYSQV